MNAPRRFTGQRLVIASHNPGKVREIAALLAPFAVEVVPAAALGLDEPEETGASFLANADLKARAAAAAAGLPALGGRPGIHSARWAGKDRDFDAAMGRVEHELDGRDRSAAFVCALALCWPDGHCEIFEGRAEGALVWPPRGALGFGYDPMFVPAGRTETFGEMDQDEKHCISHRADAFNKLVAACFGG